MGKQTWISVMVLIAILIMACGIILYVFPITSNGRLISIAGRGPLINSDINFYILNDDGSKGRLAGNTSSDEYGIYEVEIQANGNDYLLAEATGGYYEDGLNRSIPLLPSETLSAVVPAADNETWLTITPLTHMAAKRARTLAENGTPLAVALPSTNAGIAQQYGLIDISWNLPVIADDEDWVVTANMDERVYALVLAGISEEADTLHVSTMELADALANDASDGLLDGRNDTGPVNMETLETSTVPLPPDAGTKGVQDGMASAPVAPTMQPNKANSAIPLQPVHLGMNGAGKFYVTSTMLPAAIAGDHYNYQLGATGGAPPYTCSIMMQNADGTLSLLPFWLQLANNCILSGDVPLLAGGKTMDISQPFTVNMCDTAGACSIFELRVTIVEKWPAIMPEDVTIYVNERCDIRLATAKGGSPPYYYRSDYLRQGASPMGTIVDLNGNLVGTPSRTGTFRVGVCAIDLIGANSCKQSTVRVISRNATLSITKTGSGTGKVYAEPYESSGVYAYGTDVTLTATADTGSIFAGWSGACSGTGSTCTLTMDSDKDVEAEFTGGGVQPSAELSVKITGGRCGNVKGEASGPVGTMLAVYTDNGGTPAGSINCGSWSRGPDTQYQCQRGDNDPQATGWAAEAGNHVDATVYGGGFSGMESAQGTFRCQ